MSAWERTVSDRNSCHGPGALVPERQEYDMPHVLTGSQLPPGYGSVNPFVAVSGKGGAGARP